MFLGSDRFPLKLSQTLDTSLRPPTSPSSLTIEREMGELVSVVEEQKQIKNYQIQCFLCKCIFHIYVHPYGSPREKNIKKG